MGERISFSIFIASTTTTPCPSCTSLPAARWILTILPGISDSTVWGPSEAVRACSTSSRLRSSTASRWKSRPATRMSKPWAPRSSTIASNCLPSSITE